MTELVQLISRYGLPTVLDYRSFEIYTILV